MFFSYQLFTKYNYNSLILSKIKVLRYMGCILSTVDTLRSKRFTKEKTYKKLYDK